MNRKTQYAINGAIGGTLISALVNAFKQLNRIEENPQLKFDWSGLMKAGGKGALIGGGSGFVVGAIVDEVNANTKAINTDAYLSSFAFAVKADKNSSLYKVSERKCEQVIKFIEKEFASELSDVPFQGGSNAKGTAIISYSINFSMVFRGVYMRTGFSAPSLRGVEKYESKQSNPNRLLQNIPISQTLLIFSQ